MAMNMVDEQQAAWAEGLFLVPYGCVRTPIAHLDLSVW